jgi:hypothetical protein
MVQEKRVPMRQGVLVSLCANGVLVSTYAPGRSLLPMMTRRRFSMANEPFQRLWCGGAKGPLRCAERMQRHMRCGHTAVPVGIQQRGGPWRVCEALQRRSDSVEPCAQLGGVAVGGSQLCVRDTAQCVCVCVCVCLHVLVCVCVCARARMGGGRGGGGGWCYD